MLHLFHYHGYLMKENINHDWYRLAKYTCNLLQLWEIELIYSFDGNHHLI